MSALDEIRELLADSRPDWTALPLPDGRIEVWDGWRKPIATFPVGTPPLAILVAAALEDRAWREGYAAGIAAARRRRWWWPWRSERRVK